jgi:hypothetical protein
MLEPKTSQIMVPNRSSALAPLSFVASIALSCLILVPKIFADSVGSDVDAFDRDLGLERMGPNIVNVDPETIDSESSTSTPKQQRTRKKSPASHVPHLTNALSYQPSQSVTDAVRGYMIAKLTQNDASTLPAIEKRFANNSIPKRFDQIFARYGFSDRNIGDTVAGYLVVSWEIVHNTNASADSTGIRRVRETIRQRMEQKGKVANLSNADKQKYSEIIKYLTVLISDEQNRLQRANNEAGKRKLENQVAQPPLRIGLDLRRLQLTDRGFVSG